MPAEARLLGRPSDAIVSLMRDRDVHRARPPPVAPITLEVVERRHDAGYVVGRRKITCIVAA